MGSGDIPLGLPATGTTTTNGNAQTPDAADDILVAQDFVVAKYGPDGNVSGSYATRARAPTTLRVLPPTGFDYLATALGDLPTVGGPTTGYAFSTGLRVLSGLVNGPATAEAPVTPTAFGAIVGGHPSTITFGGEVFTTADGVTYTAPSAHTITRDTSNGGAIYTVASQLPAASRYAGQAALALTDTATVNLDFFSGYSGHALIVPLSVLGADGLVTSTSIANQKIAAVAFNFFDDSFGGDFQTYATARNYTTFAAAANAATDYVDSKVYTDLVMVSGGSTGYSTGSTLTVKALQSGFDLKTNVSPNANDGRALDNFLFVQATNPAGQSIVFATGDVGNTRTGGPTIDSFSLSRGLDDGGLLGVAPNGLLPFRAFLPSNSGGVIQPAAVASTALFIANPASSAGQTTSRLYQADLGLGADNSASTISATFGTLTYNATPYADRVPTADPGTPPGDIVNPLADPRSSVAVSGVTIGSTLTSGGAPTLFTSPLLATAAGGGRTWQIAPGSGTRSGYVGYLVLENATDNGASVAAGVESTLGTQAGDNFGSMRLAAGYRSTADGDLIGGATTGTFDGFVAGFVEKEGSGATVSARPFLGTIDLTLDAAANEVGARVTYNDGAAHSLDLGTRPVIDEQNAYIQPGNYGAAVNSGGAHAALIAGDGVKAGLGSAGAAIPTYQHVQWGFFFGDLAPNAGKRAHTALSSWAAGKAYSGPSCATSGGSVNCGIQGSATYSGHAIGSVAADASGAIKTVVGSFTQTWNFDARTGAMALAFDGTNYNAALTVTGTTRLSYGGVSDVVDSRAAKIDGELVDVGTVAGQPKPQGTVGQFQIRNYAGTYQANGTFAGDIDP